MRLGGPPASLHGAPARAGVVRMWRSPMPRAKCDHRTVLRLRIEAAVRLWGSANRPRLRPGTHPGNQHAVLDMAETSYP
jgi:hypothetical protein